MSLPLFSSMKNSPVIGMCNKLIMHFKVTKEQAHPWDILKTVCAIETNRKDSGSIATVRSLQVTEVKLSSQTKNISEEGR
jgi:hypothetical protein